MASSPYNSRRECQGGHADQDDWEYPWTPSNNTSPVFSNPGQSVPPSLRRAVHAQVPSTPLRPNGSMLYSSNYGTARAPWVVNATPVPCSGSTASPQNVSWVDWGHSSPFDHPSQGGLQPAISFNSVAAVSRNGADDHTLAGGEDGHGRGSDSQSERHRPSQFKCRWVGCTYAGAFTRETCLWRHIKTTHVSPSLFKCPEPQCNKTFGRKDKLQSHMRQAHLTSVGHCPSCHS